MAKAVSAGWRRVRHLPAAAAVTHWAGPNDLNTVSPVEDLRMAVPQTTLWSQSCAKNGAPPGKRNRKRAGFDIIVTSPAVASKYKLRKTEVGAAGCRDWADFAQP